MPKDICIVWLNTKQLTHRQCSKFNHIYINMNITKSSTKQQYSQPIGRFTIDTILPSIYTQARWQVSEVLQLLCTIYLHHVSAHIPTCLHQTSSRQTTNSSHTYPQLFPTYKLLNVGLDRFAPQTTCINIEQMAVRD